MIPAALNTSCPRPDFLATERGKLAGVWARWVERTLNAQVNDDSALRGAFDEHGDGWYDGRFTALTLARLVAAWSWREVLAVEPDRLRHALQEGLGFLLRRQAPDGRLDLGGAYSPNEIGFTLPGLCAAYSCLRATDSRVWDEFLADLQRFILRGAEAVCAGEAYTANHRWAAAAAPLAAVNRLWPDARYEKKIRDYLDDGIDCDADGCWFEERSPNYNAVASTGLLVLADELNRPDLLEIFRRHGEFLLRMLQPNGEVDSSFSHRQDRHKPNCAPLTYALARRLAQITQDGRYTTLALSLPEAACAPAADLLPLLFQIDRHREAVPEPRPIAEHYEVYLPHSQIARVRRGASALTLAADAGGHFFDTVRDRWGGARRSDDWFHLHHRGVVIETLHLAGAGMQNMQPQALAVAGKAHYELRGHVDGWIHRLHFRPGAPEVFMPWHWNYAAEVAWKNRQIGLKIAATSPDSLGASLCLWVRAGVKFSVGEAGDLRLLGAGETHALGGGSAVRLIGQDGSSIGITGLPSAAHRHNFGHPPAIPSALREHCGCLFLGLSFPVDLQLELHLSERNEPDSPANAST